jgi:iron complex outermembrane receptor protein
MSPLKSGAIVRSALDMARNAWKNADWSFRGPRQEHQKIKRLARLSFARICWIAIAALVAESPYRCAWAQHASDNPVGSAEDAYGLTLGLETIGLYLPVSVRGFNPQAAGNVRIDGLFFDQQGSLSNRVVEGSSIRVGVSEIGYVFPAPTGIVDYDLRHATGSANATIVASAGPFQAHGLSIDANLPVISGELQVPIGASYQVSTQTFFAANPGYTSSLTSIGATPQWSPNDRVTIRALMDWQQTRRAKTFPFIFTAGDFLPPVIPRNYMGQNWAEGSGLSENFGGIITAQLNHGWSFAAGIFRSVSDSPLSFSDFYINTEPNGLAEHLVVGYPDQNVFSTSGEARLVGHFSQGSWGHEVVLLARGRNTFARYGGSDVVEVGEAQISNAAQVPEPTFTYFARTADRTELWGVGVAYRAHWQQRADFALGVQQESYNKVVTLPPTPQIRLTDRPLRAYGNAALTLTSSLTAYAGFTQGLEDSGVAPSAAVNRGAILPAARTWQVDSGVRYLITPELKIITGVFEIQKPYFNFDPSGIDRNLGMQVAKGIELSISGELAKHLNITAGMLSGTVRVIGPNLAAEGVGPIAFGQPRLTYVLNADYSGFKWPALSMDLNITHVGASPASVDNALYSQTLNQVDLGGRYRFTMAGKAATLRAQVLNLTNARAWSSGYSSGLFQQSPRSIFAYLTTDF